MKPKMKPTKYKLLRYSQTDQRVWQSPTGDLYLADHSGDSDRMPPGRRTLHDDKGRPDETDDGPLRILAMKEIGVSGSKYTPGLLTACVQVYAERMEQTSEVVILIGVAKFLSEHYEVPLMMDTPAGRFFLVPSSSKP